jgi:hypothetical protein
MPKEHHLSYMSSRPLIERQVQSFVCPIIDCSERERELRKEERVVPSRVD